MFVSLSPSLIAMFGRWTFLLTIDHTHTPYRQPTANVLPDSGFHSIQHMSRWNSWDSANELHATPTVSYEHSNKTIWMRTLQIQIIHSYMVVTQCNSESKCTVRLKHKIVCRTFVDKGATQISWQGQWPIDAENPVLNGIKAPGDI